MAEAFAQPFWPFQPERMSRVAGTGMPIAAGLTLYAASVVELRALALVLCTFSLVILLTWATRLMASILSGKERASDILRSKETFEHDLLPTIICQSDGCIVWHNDAAQNLTISQNAKPQNPGANTISAFLDDHLPNAPATVRRLVNEALRDGFAQDRLIGLIGQVAVQVRLVNDHLLWRFDFKTSARKEEQADSAMLTVGRKGTILFMNASARALIGARVKSVGLLFKTGMPMSGQIAALQTAEGTLRVRVEIQKLQTDRSHVFLNPLKDDEERENYFLKDLPIPLLQLSLKGKVEQANTAALTLLGYADLSGRSLGEIFDSHGVLIEEWVEKASNAHVTTDVEFLRVLGAKKETFVQVSLKRIDEGSEPFLVAILNDATKLKSLEAQFVQSQKMQAIGQLAGGVAHDFNNLLTAISGHCDLMLLRHDPGDQDYADLMQVHQNSNRAAGLVSQLLAFSRKQTLQLERLDLRNTLSDLTHLLNRLVGEKVTLTLTHDPVLRAVRADKRQLEQVIMNLVVNARDAMPDGGEITIQTESVTLTAPLKRDRVTVPIGDYIIVRVRDVGTGIDEEALQKIFEPFYTTKRVGEGTGLGLSTAYGIVKQTGGFIFADSKLGTGTCFSLLFPATDDCVKQTSKTLDYYPKPTKELCSGVVLLVEDEAPVRAFASRALSMRGFDVIEAESAERALELLDDETLEVDVFVTDVVMPGMDGPTWVKKALKVRPKVKVVFVSGYAEGAFQGENPEFTGSVFLPKPFSLAELTSTVQSQMSAV